MLRVLIVLVLLTSLMGCASMGSLGAKWNEAIKNEEARLLLEEQTVQLKNRERVHRALKSGDISLVSASPGRIGMGVIAIILGVVGLGVTVSDASDKRDIASMDAEGVMTLKEEATWTKGHTVCMTLSLGVIFGGIASCMR